MNSENPKLRQEQRSEHDQEVVQHVAQQAEGQQFATVEELLRYDSEQNPVPAEVGERLSASTGAEPKRSRSWFKGLFGS
jgi:hypothetical protein